MTIEYDYENLPLDGMGYDDDDDDDYAEFEKWYKANERRFYTGQMNEKEIAYSAWLAGYELGIKQGTA